MRRAIFPGSCGAYMCISYTSIWWEASDTWPEIHCVTCLKCFWQASCGRSGVISVLKMGRQDIGYRTAAYTFVEAVRRKGCHRRGDMLIFPEYQVITTALTASLKLHINQQHTALEWTLNITLPLMGPPWLGRDGDCLCMSEKSCGYGFIGLSKLALNGVQKREGSHQSCIQVFP